MTEQQEDCDLRTYAVSFELCRFKLKKTNDPVIPTGSVKYWEILINVKSAIWEDSLFNGDMYIIFKTENDKNYCLQLEEGNNVALVTAVCTIPGKVLENDFFTVTVFAIDHTNDNRYTSNPVTVHLTRSGFTTDLESYDFENETGDIFSQLRELINNCLVDVRVEGNQLLFIKEDTVYYRFTITNHQHTSSQITDLEDTIGLEIKRGYQVLVNKIRTYGE